MYTFDLTHEPLTNLELKTEQEKVKAIRKEQVKYSCISDIFHAFIFIALYFGQMLSGYAVAVAIAISTVCALILAMTTKQNFKPTNLIVTAIIALTAALTVIFILTQTMQQPFTGALIAGLLTGSIVIVGATLGRKIKKVMVIIEELKPMIDDTNAQQELAKLCQQCPFLADYREQASRYLRPHLTYGELYAMRKWAEKELQKRA